MMRCFALWALESLCLMVTADDSVQRGEHLPAEAFYKIKLPNFDRPDPSAGLSTNSPEVLRREAAEYASEADALRFFIERNKLVGLHRLLHFDENMLQLALLAIKYPGQCENMRLVPKWAEWIKHHQKPLQYDFRLDSDRFLAFMFDRIEHKGHTTEYTVDLNHVFGELYEACWEKRCSRSMSTESFRTVVDSHVSTDIESAPALICLRDPDKGYTACWPDTTSRSESQGHVLASTTSCVPLVITAPQGLHPWQRDTKGEEILTTIYITKPCVTLSSPA